jgi:hypothetical protein
MKLVAFVQISNELHIIPDDVQKSARRPTDKLSDGRPERTKNEKTIGEHQWGAGQSSSNAFVRDLWRIINK